MKFEVKVLMFGKSGVGKTSLLAAMYNSLQNWNGFEDLKRNCEESHDLDAALDGLKKYIRTLADGEPIGIPPTSGQKKFTFTVGSHVSEHSLDIVFTDMPGEWLDEKLKKNDWLNLMQSSDIIIAVISSPAMMEEEQNYHDELNRPIRFQEYLNEALRPANKDSGSKRIFLVPVKCEKYMNDEAMLSTTMRNSYRHHRATIRNNGHFCYGLPVNTLGAVVFDRFELNKDGFPVEHYKVRSFFDCIKNLSLPSTEWQPKNHDVLVAHILEHCFARLIFSFPENDKIIKPIKEKISRLCTAEKYETPETDYIEKFIVKKNDSCFAGDTPVLMADGRHIPMAMLKVGMEVLTMNSTGAFEPQRISKVSKHKHIPLIAVSVGDYKLRVTARHLFKIGKKWKSAESLVVGDMITAFQQDALKPVTKTVVSMSHKTVICDAYNIYVKRNSNYIAGGVLVSSFVNLHRSRQILEYLIDILFKNTNRRTCNAT